MSAPKTDPPLDLDDLCAGVGAWARPRGPGASARWLEVAHPLHLEAVSWMAQGSQEGCLVRASWLLTLALKLAAAEGICEVAEGRPVVPAYETGSRWMSFLDTAVLLERARRLGWCTISPPIGSIFTPNPRSVIKRTERCPHPSPVAGFQ